MNKTVTINISGIIFHIEEDAYDSLSKYLGAIKGYFSKTDGGNEIMSDIEARIAELLQEKINASKQVILMTDVDYVKNVMGRPEEFGAESPKEEEEAKSTTGEQSYREQPKIKRRLFRNPDEKVIGGVCSGLAAYFDIDPVWVRLAMFLLIFFGGISIWVYVILWIVIPKARTTADRLAMRGEPANVNTIFQSFKEEAEDVKNRGKEYSQQFYQTSANVRRGGVAALHTFFNIAARLLGLLLLFIGGFLLFLYVLILFGISIAVGRVDTSFADWKPLILDSQSDYTLALLSFIIVFGIPVLVIIFAGVKLLFRINYSNRWLNLSMGIILFIGILMGSYVAMSGLHQFGAESNLKEITELHGTGDTLVLKMSPVSEQLKALDFENKDDLEINLSDNHTYRLAITPGKQKSILGTAKLDVVESTSDSVELAVYRSAHGSSKRTANENAKAISYAYKQNGNELLFDEIFSVKPGSKFRVQEVNIKLKLPVGKVVRFDKSMKYFLHNVDNLSNTWTGDMVGRRWIMTKKGLKCLDCKDLEEHDDEENNDEIKTEHVTINDQGIHVKSKDSEIKIDENGVNIKTPEQELHISEDHKKEKEKHKQ